MMYSFKEIFFTLILIILLGCGNDSEAQHEVSKPSAQKVLQVGADQIPLLVSKLKGKKIGLLCNQSSLTGGTHLIDTLHAKGINIVKIFAPEHGYRGTAQAGEYVKNDTDLKTGAPVLSLYGKNKTVPAERLAGIDQIVFDLQDVGARFYTYISTLHYVMDAAAKAEIPVLILDRPNPNGHYVAGPVKSPDIQSFVAMHPIPIVHGMTIGEYAQMINGEGWLTDAAKCALEVLTMENYSHDLVYNLPIKPSPNLPNLKSILAYPSTCLFEGTVLSEGRGTPAPFLTFGHPDLQNQTFSFTPQPNATGWKVKLEGQLCNGVDLSHLSVEELRKKEFSLRYLVDAYNDFPDKENFFLKTNFFDLLIGNKTIRKMIIEGKTAKEIEATWQSDLDAFKKVRAKYLLYP